MLKKFTHVQIYPRENVHIYSRPIDTLPEQVTEEERLSVEKGMLHMTFIRQFLKPGSNMGPSSITPFVTALFWILH